MIRDLVDEANLSFLEQINVETLVSTKSLSE